MRTIMGFLVTVELSEQAAHQIAGMAADKVDAKSMEAAALHIIRCSDCCAVTDIHAIMACNTTPEGHGRAAMDVAEQFILAHADKVGTLQ